MELKMNRRDFLKYQIKGTLWLAAATSGLILPEKTLAAATPDIAVAKGKATAATRAAVELLGGIGNFVKKGNRVLIKPNISCMSPPDRGVTTNPEVAREVVAMCQEAGASNIVVTDNTMWPGKRSIDVTGIGAVKSLGARVVVLRDPAVFKETAIPNASILTKTDIMKEALKADVIIAVPVAKSHSAAAVSLGMKGMMGLVYNRLIFHQLDVHTAIVDLASVLKAQLTVIDAIRVLSTGGPIGPGKVLNMNTVIASKDIVAADAYAVSAFEWYGKRFKPDQVRYIREAHERGLGRMDIENLKIKEVSV